MGMSYGWAWLPHWPVVYLMCFSQIQRRSFGISRNGERNVQRRVFPPLLWNRYEPDNLFGNEPRNETDEFNHMWMSRCLWIRVRLLVLPRTGQWLSYLIGLGNRHLRSRLPTRYECYWMSRGTGYDVVFSIRPLPSILPIIELRLHMFR